MMTARSYCGYIKRRMGKTSLVTSVKDVFIKDLEGQIKTSVYMIKSVYMMYVRDQIFISYLGVDFKDEDKAKVLIYLVSVRFMFIFYRSSRLPIHVIFAPISHVIFGPIHVIFAPFHVIFAPFHVILPPLLRRL
jgi:hypothetical protein